MAGTYHFTVTATDTLGATGSQSYTVIITGPFAEFLVTVEGSSTVSAGTSFLVAVQAADQNGNPITGGYTSPNPVTLSSNPPSANSNLPNPNVTLNTSGFGIALVTLDTVGTYTLSASAGSYGTPLPPSVTVVAAAPCKLMFVTQPMNTETGVKLNKVSVAIVDSFGNIVTGDSSDVVTLSLASGPAGGAFLRTAADGDGDQRRGRFNNLTLVVPGSYTLGAVVPSKHTGPNSNAFRIAPLQVVSGCRSPLVDRLLGVVQRTVPGELDDAGRVRPGLRPRHRRHGAAADGDPDHRPQPGRHRSYVPGTVVLNTATNSLTFVETDTTSAANNTNPILPDGTYYAVIRGTNASPPTGSSTTDSRPSTAAAASWTARTRARPATTSPPRSRSPPTRRPPHGGRGVGAGHGRRSAPGAQCSGQQPADPVPWRPAGLHR